MKYRHLMSGGVKGEFSAFPANQWGSHFFGKRKKQLWFKNLAFWMIVLFLHQALADIVPIPIEKAPLNPAIQPHKTPPPTSVTEKPPAETMDVLGATALENPVHTQNSLEVSLAGTADLPTAIQKASRAVWMLSGKKEKVSVHESDFVTVTVTSTILSGGSGFFTDFHPRLIFTNFHVVNLFVKEGLSNVTLSQNGVESDLKINALFALSIVADIAILETNSDAPFHLNLQSEPLSEDEDLVILGYPSGTFHAIRKTGPLISFFKGWQEFPIESESIKGTSGGPVINSTSQVVGILKIGKNDAAIFTGRNQLKAVLNGEIGVRCGEDSPEKCLEKAVLLAKRRGFDGDAEAQYSLSRMYLEGEDVERDAVQSFFWLKKAAKQSHPQAQYELGLMYVDIGQAVVEYDAEKAAFWLEKPAKQGHTRAKYLLDWLMTK